MAPAHITTQEPSMKPSFRKVPHSRSHVRAAARPRQAGQGMTEYIIIVALIAVAAIGIYTLFGQTIRNQTAGLALEMSGQDAATAIGNAQTTATAAQTNANVRKGLDNFNASNRP
jgi:Flp pilus assembly pilin Flp